MTVPLSVSSDREVKELVVDLAPDNFQQTEQSRSPRDVFRAVITAASYGDRSHQHRDQKEASTVLANDPFRAIQSLRGSPLRSNELLEFSMHGRTFFDGRGVSG